MDQVFEATAFILDSNQNKSSHHVKYIRYTFEILGLAAGKLSIMIPEVALDLLFFQMSF